MKEQKDLFNDWEALPAEVLEIIERMNADNDSGEWNYTRAEYYKTELETIGYTYDYDLTAEPYNLRKI